MPTGTSVRAVTAGEVVSAGWAGSYGYEVIIAHPDGTYSQYAHLSAISVSEGQPVTSGQRIGRSGSTGNSTGPHLHFEVLVGGVHRDPRVALRNVTGEPLSGSQRSVFVARKAALFAMLDRDDVAAPRVASAAGVVAERNQRGDD